MSGLPVKRASELAQEEQRHEWLIEDLWADQAVGILGGEPKCCKSFLALDAAVSVASGSPCLRRYPVRRTGPVLLFPAEDALPVVRERIEGICAAAQVDIQKLPLFVITAPRLLLDVPQDQQRLQQTVADIRPALLVLDPFIRLHRVDENASNQVAPLLGYLRELQRVYHCAVLLVHHARKGAGNERPGQALRGSSDLHGWGDSNLYLRRKRQALSLTIEHRAAPSGQPIPLALSQHDGATALCVLDEDQDLAVDQPVVSVQQRVIEALSIAQQPVPVRLLREQCKIRTATLCDALNELAQNGHVTQTSKGYSISQLTDPFPVSVSRSPIHPLGNGNRKQPEHTQLPLSPEYQLD